MNETVERLFKSSPHFSKLAVEKFKGSDYEDIREFLEDNSYELLEETIEILEYPEDFEEQHDKFIFKLTLDLKDGTLFCGLDVNREFPPEMMHAALMIHVRTAKERLNLTTEELCDMFREADEKMDVKEGLD